VISLSRDALFIQFERNQFPLYAQFLLLGQGFAIYKILGEFGNPSQPGLQGGGGIVYIVPIEAITHFQPKGIPRRQTDRFDPVVGPRFKYPVPYLFYLVIFTIDFKSARSGITGSRYDYMGYPRKIGHFEGIELQRCQIYGGQRLHGLYGLWSLDGQK